MRDRFVKLQFSYWLLAIWLLAAGVPCPSVFSVASVVKRFRFCPYPVPCNLSPVTFDGAAMLTMLRDLIQHKVQANAALLKAIRQHDKAAQDEELRKLLHHILLANRFWFMLSLGRELDVKKESQVPESLEQIAARYRETHEEELTWIFQIHEADLARKLETPFIPG